MDALNLAWQAQCRQINVQEHQPFSLMNAGGRTLRLRGTTGMLLVTCFDHPADIELSPMQQFTIPNNGLVLIDIISREEALVDILPRVSATAGKSVWSFCTRIVMRLRTASLA